MKNYSKTPLEISNRLKMAINEQRLAANKLCKALGYSFYHVLKKKNFIGCVLAPGKIIPLELKVRSCSSTQFDSILIEKKLVDSLHKRAKQAGYTTVWYAEYYQADDVILYFAIDETPFEWVIEKCNANTLEGSKKTDKVCSFLNKSFATRVDLNPKAEIPVESGYNVRKEVILF